MDHQHIIRVWLAGLVLCTLAAFPHVASGGDPFLERAKRQMQEGKPPTKPVAPDATGDDTSKGDTPAKAVDTRT